MKQKSVLNLLINPFEHLSSFASLAVGIVIMAVSSVICFYSGIFLDGVLDIHLNADIQMTWAKAFGFPFVSVACLIVCIIIMTLIFTREFRVIDIAGRLTLARAPFLLASCFGFGVTVPSAQEIISNPYVIFHNVGFMVVLVLSLVVSIWALILSVNAVRTSTNLRSGKLAGVIIMAMVLAEIIARHIMALI